MEKSCALETSLSVRVLHAGILITQLANQSTPLLALDVMSVMTNQMSCLRDGTECAEITLFFGRPMGVRLKVVTSFSFIYVFYLSHARLFGLLTYITLCLDAIKVKRNDNISCN